MVKLEDMAVVVQRVSTANWTMAGMHERDHKVPLQHNYQPLDVAIEEEWSSNSSLDAGRRSAIK